MKTQSPELTQGDILLFHVNESSLISRLVAAATRSSVTHAAIAYDAQRVASVAPGGLSLTTIGIAPPDAKDVLKMSVMRLTPTPEDYAVPIRSRVDAYLGKNIRYDYAGIVLIAGMLLYEELVPSTPLHKALYVLLRHACTVLDRIINDTVNDRKKLKDALFMTCSQFAYQCYEDVGGAYHLKAQNPYLLKAEVPGRVRLMDYAADVGLPSISFAQNESHFQSEQPDQLDALLQPLLAALTISNDQEAFQPDADALLATMQTDAAYQVFGMAGLFKRQIEEMLDRLGLSLAMPSLFVTPATLYRDTKNLRHLRDETITILH